MMQIIFDESLIARRRERAFAAHAAGADFLLDLAADELAERIAVVERHFPHAVELHGATGIAARRAFDTGKIETIERFETSGIFAGPGESLGIAALDDVPLAPSSANLVLSPLSLHTVNDLPGMLLRIRR